MSVTGAAALGRSAGDGRPVAAWIPLATGLLVLAAAILLVISGMLVRIQNDRDHLSLLPASVGAGESVTGELTLTNTGLLPVTVAMELRSPLGGPAPGPPPRVTESVIRTGDGQLLYQGPLGSPTGTLMTLDRGQQVHLQVTMRSEGETDAVPLAYDYYWTARAAIPGWWWITAILFVSLLVTAAFWRPFTRPVVQ